MHAHDIMIEDFGVVAAGDTLQQAAVSLRELRVPVLAVRGDERLLGTLSHRDLAIEGCGKGRDPRSTSVAEVMTPRSGFCTLEEELSAALARMVEQDLEALFVRSPSEQVVGLLTRWRVLETLASVDDRPRGPVPDYVKRVRGE